LQTSARGAHKEAKGGDGNDVLEGRGGADTLNGGVGTDTVTYASAGGAVTVNLNGTGSSGSDAAGDVLVDQIPHMRRCGFDSFAPEAPVDAETLKRSLNRYDHPYQRAADPAVPVWKLRHV
jgi:hypothetical protein